jgi:hypothetical protein
VIITSTPDFQVHARDPPSTYLTKIRTYLDPNAYKSTKKIRSLGDSTSTQVGTVQHLQTNAILKKFGPVALFPLFNAQTIHIRSMLHNSIAMFSLQTLSW